MTDLQKYVFQNVVLTDIDGKQWQGNVFSYHDKIDNDDNQNSIVLKTLDNDFIEFTEPEIKNIELNHQ